MSSTLLDTNRFIYKNAAPREIPQILQGAFAAELLSPSPCIWIVSAWISNIPLLDNTTGAFRYLEPTWPEVQIRFIPVLVKLLQEGTTVHLAVRPKDNVDFTQGLKQASGYAGAPTPACPLVLHDMADPDQHRKGILSYHFFLRGTMNYTHNGIEVQDNRLEFTTAPDAIADARGIFEAQWGGVIQ